jgi:hypothetical protein
MKKRKSSIARRAWELLSPALRETRKRSLSVLGLMRQGKAMTAAARETGVDRRTVARHLGNAIAKHSDGQYHAKPSDRISRSMVIYSEGKQVEVTIPNSKTASTIGQYFNAVRRFLNTADKRSLDAFKGVTVTDAEGEMHVLETNVKRLKKIESAKEDREFFEIYKTG